MKKCLYLLLMPLVLTFSCKETEPEPTPQPVEGKITLKDESSVVLSDEGDSKQVAFSATLRWTAASSENWLTVEPVSGEAGDAVVTLRAGANADYDPRTATVTLTCEKDTKTIQVTQKQKGALLLTESTIPVGAEGGSVIIVAKANAEVGAAIDPSATGWISNLTTKGLVDYTFEFSIKENTSEEPRSGAIVFSNAYGSETVTIEQAGFQPEYNVYGSVTCNGAGVPDVLISDGI
ncbi:MAG: BACON domain-containing protein [Bacteroidales bacterium]|nr:BACON domain-containing protein [Bacteroidales bacterium]